MEIRWPFDGQVCLGSLEGRKLVRLASHPSHPLVELKMKMSSLSSTSTQVLICRNYRGDVDMSEVEHFMPILMEKEEEGMLSPILAHGGVRFMWIKHNNLYRIPWLGGSQGAPVWTCVFIHTHGQLRAASPCPS